MLTLHWLWLNHCQLLLHPVLLATACNRALYACVCSCVVVHDTFNVINIYCRFTHMNVCIWVCECVTFCKAMDQLKSINRTMDEWILSDSSLTIAVTFTYSNPFSKQADRDRFFSCIFFYLWSIHNNCVWTEKNLLCSFTHTITP